MLFAIGAASSAIDLLSSLMSSKSTAQTGSSAQDSQTTGLFSASTSTSTSTGSTSTSTGSGSGTPQISPLTMGALISAQSQSPTAASNSATAASRSDALQDLFSQIDADGNGQITKTEFENALGAGGTNIAQADDVFSKLDANGDGSVSPDEVSQALQGHKGGGHHHHHAAGGATDGSGSSSGAGGSGSDPLMQALDGATSTSVTNSDGSTTTTTTYADGSKVSMTSAAASSTSSSANSSSAGSNATSSYNFIEQLIQRQSQAIAAQASAGVSVSA